MKILIKTIIVLLILMLPLSAQESRIIIESGVDRDVITIGGLIHYRITVKHNRDITVEYPGLAANLGAFEIRDYTAAEPEKIDDKIISRAEYVITTFDTGNYVIPPVQVGYFSEDSVQMKLRTDIIKIRVNSVKPSEAKDIKDIKSPMVIEIDYKKYVYYGLGGLAFILLVLFIIYYIRKKRRGEDIIPKRKKPILPAHIEALEMLEKLRDSTLPEEGKVKEYYIQISEIIRCYIEQRYFIYAREMTTYELCSNLRSTDAGEEAVSLISDFLESCDFVKFAKHIPDDDENRNILQQAFDIVNRTKIEYTLAAEPEHSECAVEPDNL